MTAATPVSIPELRKALVAKVRELVSADPKVAAAKAQVSFPFSSLDLEAGEIRFAGGTKAIKCSTNGRLMVSGVGGAYLARDIPAAFYQRYRDVYIERLGSLREKLWKGEGEPSVQTLFNGLVALGVCMVKLSAYLGARCTPSYKVPATLKAAGFKLHRELSQLVKSRSPAAYSFLGKVWWMQPVRQGDLVWIAQLLKFRKVLEKVRAEHPKFFPSMAANFARAGWLDTGPARCRQIATSISPLHAWLNLRECGEEEMEMETYAWLSELPTPVVSGLMIKSNYELNWLAKAKLSIRSYPKLWFEVMSLSTKLSRRNEGTAYECMKAYELALASRGKATVKQTHSAFKRKLDYLTRPFKYPQGIDKKFAALTAEQKELVVGCAGQELTLATFPPKAAGLSFAALEELYSSACNERALLTADPELVEIIKDCYLQSPAWRIKSEEAEKAAAAADRIRHEAEAARKREQELHANQYVKDLMDRLVGKATAAA